MELDLVPSSYTEDIDEKEEDYFLQFDVIVDKGQEYQIEKILPYENNLLHICNLLTSKDYKTIGLYGDPIKLGEALNTIFGFQVKPMSLDAIGFGKIAAYIKDGVIIFVMYCPAKIWEEKPLIKDGIYVTLFRILIDISQIVFLLMEDQLFKYFDHKQNHPLKKNAFISTDFVLMQKKHVDFEIKDIKFEESSVAGEFGNNFTKGLIFENDFSNIVAYHKMYESKMKIPEILRNIRSEIGIICAVEQTKRDRGFERFNKLLDNLPYEFQEKFTSLLLKTYEDQDKAISGLEGKLESLIPVCFEASKKYSKLIFLPKYTVKIFELTPLLLSTIKTKFLQRLTIYEESHQFKVAICQAIIFEEFAKNFIKNSKEQEELSLDMQKDQVLTKNLESITNSYRQSLEKIILNFYKSLRDEIEQIKIEQNKIFEISLFSLNSISSNLNDLQNVTLAKYNQEKFRIEKHQVLKEKNQVDAELDRILPTKSRNACYVIFKLTERNREKSYKLFFLTSGEFSKSIISFKVQNPIFIYNQDKEILLLMDCNDDKIYEYNLTQYGEIKDGAVTECMFSFKEISFATCDFEMENIYLFKNECIYKFDRIKADSTTQELLKIENSPDGNLIKSKLSPGGNDKYLKMVRFKDPRVFGLQSKKYLDIYDANYILKERIQIDSDSAIKTFNDKVNEYIVFFSFTRRICKVLPGLASETTFQVQSPNDHSKNKLGNPPIDVILFSHLKYGPFTTSFREDFEGIYFIVPKETPDRDNKISQLKEYTKNIPNICLFRYVNEAQIPNHIKSMEKSTCSLQILLSRVPLQLCTIENSNIIPLINGKKQSLSSLSRSKEILDKAKFIKFGFLETFMNAIDPKEIRVFSIVGRQSSGKSYLLNRVFGSRFFVAATRCTDGIWVSYAFIESKHCFIFDCEGLFSVRRNETEETKLITFLSAISDVTILNQDLSFNRYMNKLFSELSQAVDKLRGDDLFKGIIMMAVRDVPSNESEGALKEMESNFRQLISKGETKFFSKLFNNQLIFQPFNNFESDLFADEIAHIRDKLLNREARRTNVKSLMQMMKIILVQLQYDDDSKIDTIRIRFKLEEIYEKLKNYWEKPVEKSFEVEFAFSCPFVDSECSCKINLASITFPNNEEGKFNYYHLNDCLNLLVEIFNETFGISRTKQNAYEYHLVLNNFIEKFFAAKINCFENKMNNLLIEEFGNEIENDEVKYFATSQKNFVNSYQNYIKQCEETCSKCKLPCVKLSKHKDQVYNQLNEIKTRYDKIMKDSGECKELDEVEMKKYLTSKQELDEIDKLLEVEQADYDILLSYQSAFETILKAKNEAVTIKQNLNQYKEDVNRVKIEAFKINEEAFRCFINCLNDLNARKKHIFNFLEDSFASNLKSLKNLRIYEKEGLKIQQNLLKISKNLKICFGPLVINLSSINLKQEIDICDYKHEFNIINELLRNLINSQETSMREFQQIFSNIEAMDRDQKDFHNENKAEIIKIDKKYRNTENNVKHYRLKCGDLQKQIENSWYLKNKIESELQETDLKIERKTATVRALEKELAEKFKSKDLSELQNKEQSISQEVMLIMKKCESFCKLTEKKEDSRNSKFDIKSQAEELFQKIVAASSVYKIDPNEENFLETLILKVNSAKKVIEKTLLKNSTSPLKKAKEDYDNLLALCESYQDLKLRMKDEYCGNASEADVIDNEMNNETSQHHEGEDLAKKIVFEASSESLQNLEELSKIMHFFEDCIIPNKKENSIELNMPEFLLDFCNVFINKILPFFEIDFGDLVEKVNSIQGLINNKDYFEYLGFYRVIEEIAITNFSKICLVSIRILLQDLYSLKKSASYVETEQQEGMVLYLEISMSKFQAYLASDKRFSKWDQIPIELKEFIFACSKNLQLLSEELEKLNVEKQLLEEQIINNFSPEIPYKISEIDQKVSKKEDELTLTQTQLTYLRKLHWLIDNPDKFYGNFIHKIDSRMVLEFEGKFIPLLKNYYQEICKIEKKRPKNEVKEKFRLILRAAKSLTQLFSEDVLVDYQNQIFYELISEKKSEINLLKTKITDSLMRHPFVLDLITKRDHINHQLTNMRAILDGINNVKKLISQLNSLKENQNEEIKFKKEEFDNLITEKTNTEKELDICNSELNKIGEDKLVILKEINIINEIYGFIKNLENMVPENKIIQEGLLETRKIILQKNEDCATIIEILKQIESRLDEIEKKDNFKIEIGEKLTLLQTNLDFRAKIEPKNAKIQELMSRKKEISNIISTYEKKIDHLNQLKQVENDLKNSEKSYQESCDCGLDHKCYFACSICEDKMPCKFACGHEGTHICKKDKHACGKYCQKRNCSNPCAHEFGHQSTHECTSRHECNQACKYCSTTCKFFSYEDHEIHICKSDFCPKACILCSKPCASKNHNHDEEAEEIIFENKKIKLHLCGDTHKCKATCQEEGACSILISQEKKNYKTALGEIEFEYIKAEAKQNECCLYFETGKISHQGYCKCSEKSHKCKETCPCCNQFCMHDFGHSGKHYSKNHRNMEHCIFASVEKNAKVSVQESGTEVRQYNVGDRATPERCQESCLRKGRGHYHLKECPGEDECAGRNFPKFAKHATEVYEPFPQKKYDKVLCNMFWESFNWESPVYDTDRKAEISLCNFYCPRSHNEKQFCTEDAWHSLSVKPEYHNFICTKKHMEEPKIDGIDVCFLLDTTGSMSSAIEKSKTTIERIVNETKAQQDKGLKIKFSVVSYKDHCDEDQLVQAIDFSEAKDALEFLKKQDATGGGDGPEAVVDGLHKARGQNWKKTSIKFLLHILDSPPHGKEFETWGDSYPDGCPCGIDYKDVLDDIKKKEIRYYIIKLNSSVNKMVEIFKKELNIEEIDITGSLDYSDQIKDMICKCSKDLEITVLNKK